MLQLNTKLSPKSNFLLFLLLVGAAFLLRLVYFLSVKDAFWFSQPMIDSLNYHLWAKSILSGTILGDGVFPHSPLYAFWLAGMYKILDSIQPAQVAALQVLLIGPISCGLLFFLGKNLFSPIIGLLTGGCAALYGPSLFFDSNLLTTQLIHVLNIGLLLSAYWANYQKRAVTWVLPGLLLGLSTLTRPNVILMLPVLICWLWIQSGHLKNWKKIVKPSLWLTLITFLLLSPAVLRNKLVLDEWMLSVGNGGLNFYLGNYEKATGYHVPLGSLGLSAADQVKEAKETAERELNKPLTYGQSSRYWWQQAINEMVSHPMRATVLFLKKSALTFNHYEYTTSLNYNAVKNRTTVLKWPWLTFPVLACLALSGLVFIRKQWKTLFPLYGLVAVYLFSNVLLLVSAEYRYALLPAFFIFAALAIQHVYNAIKQKQWKILGIWSAMVVVLVLFVYAPFVPTWIVNYHLATAHNNFGATFAKAGNTAAAITEFKQALGYLKNQPDYQASLQLQLGKAYLNSNNHKAALQPLHSAYSAMPSNSDAGNSYANALTGLGQLNNALRVRKQVLQLDNRNPEYWINLGITYLWGNQPEQAQLAFNEALKLDPTIVEKLEQTQRTIMHYLKQQKMRQ